MSNPLWPVLLVLALVFFWAIGAYNRLVRLRAAVGTAFAALEPLLRERLAWVKGALPPAEPPAPDAPASTLDEPRTQAWRAWMPPASNWPWPWRRCAVSP